VATHQQAGAGLRARWLAHARSGWAHACSRLLTPALGPAALERAFPLQHLRPRPPRAASFTLTSSYPPLFFSHHRFLFVPDSYTPFDIAALCFRPTLLLSHPSPIPIQPLSRYPTNRRRSNLSLGPPIDPALLHRPRTTTTTAKTTSSAALRPHITSRSAPKSLCHHRALIFPHIGLSQPTFDAAALTNYRQQLEPSSLRPQLPRPDDL
jgi:hypothetical protein